MKKIFYLICCFVLIVGCSKKPATVTITAWELYQDPYYKISFKYPQGWPLVTEGGRFSVYSSPNVMNRFYDYSIKGEDGIRLLVATQKMDTLQGLEQYVDNIKNDLVNSGFDILTTEPATLAGQPGTAVHYSGVIDKKTKLEVIQLTAMRDSSLYTVKYEAFNELFTPGKVALDSAVASLKLPEPKPKAKNVDDSAPSAELASFDNNMLKIMYPANFETNLPTPKAPSELTLDIKGYRQDSFIRIDVLPAKGLSPEKVVEQNAKFFKEISRGKATIDNQKVTFINYSAAKDISSRVYFLVKNDKIYRLIINYYTPMKEAFLPAFVKSLGSLTVK
jgi:hypothetical protein